jgi:hypothetical protein
MSIRNGSQLMLDREIIAFCLRIIWNKQTDLFVFRFPMEMHIVHRKRSYGSVQEALKHSDGLTVLAFFFQVSTFLSHGQFTDLFALCQVFTLMSMKIGRGAV